MRQNDALNDFISGEKSLNTPFNIKASDTDCYHCIEVLRLLPGCRLTVVAETNGNKVLLKLLAPSLKGKKEFERELHGYKQLKRASVNTPKLIKQDDDLFGCYAIEYQFLDGALTLDSPLVLEQTDVYRQLLETMAVLHEYGSFQDDIHLGNLLWYQQQLYLIDAGSVKTEGKKQKLSKKQSYQNLARLLAQFTIPQQQQLLPLIENYSDKRQWPWTQGEQTILEAQLKTAWHKRKSDYLSKCFRSCTMTQYQHDFFTQRAFRTELFNSISDDFIENIDALMAGGEILKAGSSATIVRVKTADLDIVIKRYNIKSVWHFLRRCFRASRAATSWRNANLLEFFGIPTLKPLGFIENRFGFLRLTAYFISEFHQAGEMLDLFQQREPTENELIQVKQIFDGLAMNQISHGDLKAQNLLVDANNQVSIIDLDAMQEHSNFNKSQQALYKDKKRFIRNWQSAELKQKLESLIL